MLGRIIVGGQLVGLVELNDVDRIRLSAQRISNAYPEEPTLLKLGGGNRSELITPKAGVVKTVFNADIQRKPRIQRQPR